MPEKRKHVELWRWYATTDGVTYLRVADDYTDEDNHRYFRIQEYRNNLTMAYGLTRSQALRYMTENCIIPRIEQWLIDTVRR